MISQLKKQVDHISTIEGAGIHLKRAGKNFVGLCPFHSEKTPSFYLFPDGGFKCFGCGAHGDIINFIQKLYGMSFQDALKRLGIERGEISPEMEAKIEKRKIERQKFEAEKKRIIDLQNTLLILISATKKATKGIKTIDDLEQYGNIFQPLPRWEYNLELLSFGTDEDKRRVCKQFQDMEVVPGDRLFKPEFNHKDWLRRFNENGEPKDVGCKRISISIE